MVLEIARRTALMYLDELQQSQENRWSIQMAVLVGRRSAHPKL